MSKQNIYTIGGTVQAGSGLYIARKADDELLQLCRAGDFSFVLTSRQVGKSSLMVRTAEHLADEKIRSVIVDLTQLGVQVTAEAWYLGFLTTIADELCLETDVMNWWSANDDLGIAQRLTRFFQEIILTEIKEPVVIFVDEIDSTISLDFTDDFFAAIRYFYNARARIPEFKRLTFVLIGVATPSDLITDSHRTPFNIGRQIDLTDFTFEEIRLFADGLGLSGKHAEQVLHWILKWSHGHPYLTQRLCRTIAEQNREVWTKDEVGRIVADTFLGRMSDEDNNLQFVRDMLTRRAPDKLRVLLAYKEVRLGRKTVRDEEQSPIKSHLKLAGIVTRKNGRLVVRNPIYNEVFNRNWIKEHWPVSWLATVPTYVKAGTAVAFLLLLTSVIGLSLWVGTLQELTNRETLLAETKVQAAEKAQESAARERVLRQEAEMEKERAQQLAEAESEARTQTEAERIRAERQSLISDSLRQEEKKVRLVADKRRQEVERQRLIDKARSLAIQAERQQQSGKDELGILLARQAFVFNQKFAGPWNNQIYQALLTTLDDAGGPAILRKHTAAVRAVTFDAKGKLLASASDNGIVRVWDSKNDFKQSRILTGHEQGVRAVVFRADGNSLITTGNDNTLRLWNITKIKPGSKILGSHSDRVWTLALSSDDQILASGGADRKVMLWKLNQPGSNPQTRLDHKAWIRSVAINTNGDLLACGVEDGTIILWNISGEGIRRVAELQHKGGIKAMAFSPNENILASGGKMGDVLLWRVGQAEEKPTIIKKILAHDAPVNTIAFIPDGKKLATGSTDKKVKIWNLAENKNEPVLIFNHEAWVWSIAYSPDGNLLASGSADSNVRLWFTKTEKLAQIACDVVQRNMTINEWRKFVGTDIPYERACGNLPGAQSAEK